MWVGGSNQKSTKCWNAQIVALITDILLKLFALMTHTLGSQGGVGRFFEKKNRQGGYAY